MVNSSNIGSGVMYKIGHERYGKLVEIKRGMVGDIAVIRVGNHSEGFTNIELPVSEVYPD